MKPNTVKALLWAFTGPMVSVVAGYFAFFVLVFVLGPGLDLDDRGTSVQKFFGAAAQPALYVIPFVGSAVSWAFAFTLFRRDSPSPNHALQQTEAGHGTDPKLWL